MEFSRSEVDPELLPFIEGAIREAQDDALALTTEKFPPIVSIHERQCDDANRAHRALIRSGLGVPRLLHSQPLEASESRTTHFASTAMVLAILAFFLGERSPGGWRLNPWITALLLLAVSLFVLKPVMTSTRIRQKEMPWIATSAFSIKRTIIAYGGLGLFAGIAVFTAVLTFLSLASYYLSGEPAQAGTSLIITGTIPVFYAVSYLAIWIRLKSDLRRANKMLVAGALTSSTIQLDALERLIFRVNRHNRSCKAWTSRFTAETVGDMQAATAQVVNELVSEGSLTPEIGERLRNSAWWESRVLYTTPEFTPSAPFPTPAQLTEAAQRV